MNFSYPLGTSTAEASVARAKIQMNQTEAQLHQIELQVATDVTNAAINVQSGVERVQAAQAARELAQKTMEAEQSKFEVGMSTNYNVILTQRDLATAQNNELQAILAYRKSLVELDRLQQTTLQSSGRDRAEHRRPEQQRGRQRTADGGGGGIGAGFRAQGSGFRVQGSEHARDDRMKRAITAILIVAAIGAGAGAYYIKRSGAEVR